MIRYLIIRLVMLLFSTQSAICIMQCADGMKLFQLDDGTLDCLTCIECSDGTLKTKECTDKHDTICKPCYKSGFAGENKTLCSECSVCESGTFVTRNCSKFEDTICDHCENGTFSDTPNLQSCKNCSVCVGGEQVAACNESIDTICFYQERPNFWMIVTTTLFCLDIGFHVVLLCTYIFISLKQNKKGKGNDAASSKKESKPLKETKKESNTSANSNTFKELKSSVGKLTLEDKGKILQTNVVFRVGSAYVMTAYRSLAKYVKEGKKFNFDAYVTFSGDHDGTSGNRYEISSKTPVYLNEPFDIIVFEIVKKMTLGNHIMPRPINSVSIDIFMETELNLNFIDIINEPKRFQVTIANNTDLDTDVYMKEYEHLNKKSFSNDIKKANEEYIAFYKNKGECLVFWKYGKIGSPGSPGFIRVSKEEFKLFCMSTSHCKNWCEVLSKENSKFPKQYLLCTGIKMSAIYEDMKKKDKKLAKEIFNSLYVSNDAGCKNDDDTVGETSMAEKNNVTKKSDAVQTEDKSGNTPLMSENLIETHNSEEANKENKYDDGDCPTTAISEEKMMK